MRAVCKFRIELEDLGIDEFLRIYPKNRYISRGDCKSCNGHGVYGKNKVETECKGYGEYGFFQG